MRYTSSNGPTQRQLRASELVRHALVDIFKRIDIRDDQFYEKSITVSQVIMSADLKKATVFVHLLGSTITENASEENRELAKALHKQQKSIRRELGRQIELKFTPELRFVADDLFDQAGRIEALLDAQKRQVS